MTEKVFVDLVIEGITYTLEQDGEALRLPTHLIGNPAAHAAARAWWEPRYGHRPQKCGWCGYEGQAREWDGYYCPVCGGS